MKTDAAIGSDGDPHVPLRPPQSGLSSEEIGVPVRFAFQESLARERYEQACPQEGPGGATERAAMVDAAHDVEADVFDGVGGLHARCGVPHQ